MYICYLLALHDAFLHASLLSGATGSPVWKPRDSMEFLPPAAQQPPPPPPSASSSGAASRQGPVGNSGSAASAAASKRAQYE